MYKHKKDLHPCFGKLWQRQTPFLWSSGSASCALLGVPCPLLGRAPEVGICAWNSKQSAKIGQACCSRILDFTTQVTNTLIRWCAFLSPRNHLHFTTPLQMINIFSSILAVRFKLVCAKVQVDRNEIKIRRKQNTKGVSYILKRCRHSGSYADIRKKCLPLWQMLECKCGEISEKREPGNRRDKRTHESSIEAFVVGQF